MWWDQPLLRDFPPLLPANILDVVARACAVTEVGGLSGCSELPIPLSLGAIATAQAHHCLDVAPRVPLALLRLELLAGPRNRHPHGPRSSTEHRA